MNILKYANKIYRVIVVNIFCIIFLKVANGESSSYYMMILMALLGVVLAIVVIFGLLKCRRYMMRDQNALVKIHGQSQGAVAPIPLPRPPDHLMPSPSQATPPIKRFDILEKKF